MITLERISIIQYWHSTYGAAITDPASARVAMILERCILTEIFEVWIVRDRLPRVPRQEYPRSILYNVRRLFWKSSACRFNQSTRACGSFAWLINRVCGSYLIWSLLLEVLRTRTRVALWSKDGAAQTNPQINRLGPRTLRRRACHYLVLG